MEHSVPSQSFVTGFDTEIRSITWTIPNFPQIRKDKSTIDSQNIEFTAGEATAHPLQWTAALIQNEKDGKRWIDICLEISSRDREDMIDVDATNHASFGYAEVGCAIKNNSGGIIKEDGTGPTKVFSTGAKSSAHELSLQLVTALWLGEPLVYMPSELCVEKFIDADDDEVCPEDEENLVIHLTFKLHTPKSTNSVEAIMERFRVIFFNRLREDLGGLLNSSVPCTDIKIITSDKQEFTVQRGILAVRSEVFAAMLSADMIEANSGVIKLPDISSAGFEVLRNFLYTGELLPEWRETEVLLELMNAAEKYQLQELLQFLDLTAGKVCNSQNVMRLITLSRLLSLKVAEEELMTFARKEGMLLDGDELPVTDDDSDESVTDDDNHDADEPVTDDNSDESGTDDDESGEPDAKKQKMN